MNKNYTAAYNKTFRKKKRRGRKKEGNN